MNYFSLVVFYLLISATCSFAQVASRVSTETSNTPRSFTIVRWLGSWAEVRKEHKISNGYALPVIIRHDSTSWSDYQLIFLKRLDAGTALLRIRREIQKSRVRRYGNRAKTKVAPSHKANKFDLPVNLFLSGA